MKPILFGKNSTTFTSMGLGVLIDAIDCVVTEQRNGLYELKMTYPQDGQHFSEIEIQSIIYAKPADGKNPQPFRIYKITKPLNKKVEIYAQHISYQLSSIPVMPFTAMNIADCLTNLKSKAAESCPFDFYSDKSTVATYSQSVPASIRERLGGVQGSVLDVYGGEYEFDGYDVHLWNARGSDKHITLRYGKNIVDIKQEENISNTYTGICPFWAGGEGVEVVTLPEKVVESVYADSFPYRLTKAVDFSNEFQTKPTEAQLRAKAEAYVEANAIGVPQVSIDVDFVALWQTEEYKDFAALQRVNLCDEVTVLFETLGINVKSKVVETQYDVLKERYSSIKVGTATQTLAGTINKIQTDAAKQQTDITTRITQAVKTATDLITGQSGGYVVTNCDANGHPYEILIMDTPSMSTATKVWRWNNAGLGFSPNGYNGPYTTAITQDGKIVADFITAGTMSANRIKGGVLELGDDDNANGQIYIYDADGNRCGQINNSGIAIFSPSSLQQVIINPEIGFVQRDSAGNEYYGLSSITYPDIPALDYKELWSYEGVDYDLFVTQDDHYTTDSQGYLTYYYYYCNYHWNHVSAAWEVTKTKQTGSTTVTVTLPEIFQGKNISVSITPEGIDEDKISSDTYLRYYVEYDPTLPKCKGDGTTWTDTSPSEASVLPPEWWDANAGHYPEGNMKDTALAYDGSYPSHLVLPDPSEYYQAMDPEDLGDFDPNNCEITYTLDNVAGTIEIEVEAYSTNGYNINELLKLRVVAVC